MRFWCTECEGPMMVAFQLDMTGGEGREGHHE